MEQRIKDILDDLQERLSGRQLVLQLASRDVTEYDRGKIMGQIEMLSIVMRELAQADPKKSK